MTKEEKAYTLENNTCPSDWESAIRAYQGGPDNVNQSQSYLNNPALLLNEEKFTGKWYSGFIFIGPKVTSTMANIQNNVDRPAKRATSVVEGLKARGYTMSQHKINKVWKKSLKV